MAEDANDRPLRPLSRHRPAPRALRRLEKGRADRETVYGGDPHGVAAGFVAAGALWIHVVDLDAAFGDGSNRALIRDLASTVAVRVQTGGGLRTEEDLAEVLDSGVARAVIGTAAIENPALVRRAMERWGAERIAVGLDARGRRPAARGGRRRAGRTSSTSRARSSTWACAPSSTPTSSATG